MSHGRLFDGNATAGDLAEVFAFDTTTAVTICVACRDTHPVATLHAYLRAPGIVLRCASCDAVQIRLVRERSQMARPQRRRRARVPTRSPRRLRGGRRRHAQ